MMPEIITDCRIGVSPEQSKFVGSLHTSITKLLNPKFAFDMDYSTWRDEYIGSNTYTAVVHYLANFQVSASNLKLAKEIAEEMWLAACGQDVPKVKACLRKVLPLRVIEYDKIKDDQAKWDYLCARTPGDIVGHHYQEISKILANKVEGYILEAMSGFNSYFPSDQKYEVCALDYSKEGLLRYPFPERKRICYNLDHLKHDRKIKCFVGGDFDFIVVCRGIKYPKYPILMFKECFRILKNGGQLILVENEFAGYSDLTRRPLELKVIDGYLRRAGFGRVSIEELKLDYSPFEVGHDFMIIASK